MALDKKYHRTAKLLAKSVTIKDVLSIQAVLRKNRADLFRGPVSRRDCNRIGRLIHKYASTGKKVKESTVKLEDVSDTVTQ